jgi:hypothetical protein
MNQSTGDKPIILIFFVYRRWPEYKAVDNFTIVESSYRNDAGDNDNGKGNIEHVAIKDLKIYFNCKIQNS